MASVLTYKQVLDILQDIARRHYQINTFFVGENHDLNAEDLIYPVLFVRPTTAKFPQTGGEYKTVEMKLEVRVLDKQLQNGIDEPDVTNDTFRICQDVINEINQHPFYLRSNTTILGDIELSTVNEFNDDYTCGWGFDLNLQMVNTNSFCGLPMDDITGYSANGPVNTGYTIQYNYLQCNDQLSACTYLDSFIDYKIAINTGSSANYYTTGATLFGSNLIFNRNDMLSAYTVDLSPLVVTGYLSTSGGTVTGNTLFTQNLSASTFYSGSTNLYDVIETMITGVTSGLTGSVNINGLNTYTGGSIAHQSINISGLTIDNINVSGSSVFNTLTASSISATTFYSGSTNWEDIITDIVTGVTVSLVNTHVQNGLNTYTGGTADLPTVNISAATLASLSVSGSAIFNTIDVSVISGSSGSANISLTNSATTITTDDGGFLSPYVIINPSKIELAGLNTGDVTLDSNNLLINHGTKINLNAPLTQVTGSMNISGGSLSSGGTDLYNIFITTNDGNDITRVGNGLNTYTGGTANNPTVNISAATLDNLTVTGQSNFTTIYSGGTDLINIINSSVTGVTSGLTFTRVQPGLNTYTGGTADYPTVNISAATLATLTVSGATSLGVVSATTMYSGSTDMSVLFATPANITLINSQLLTKANLSGATFTGQINGTVFSAISVYGDTLYSGTTELGTLIPKATHIQNGLNTYTAGTASLPTVNVSGLTIDNINVSGSAIFNTLSAVTLSASTIYSGSTNLSVIIQSLSTTNNTFIQNGLNTYTGGTNSRPTVNISAATLDTLIVTGNTSLSATSAFTITILNSGSTSTGNLTDWNYNTIKSGVTTSNIIGGTGNTINNDLRNVQILGGIAITAKNSDTTYVGTLTGTSIYSNTFYSASTELGSVIQRMITGVTSGITGSITSGTSYGNATHVFSGVTGTYLAFKSLSAGTNITLTNGDAITINSTASSANNTLPFNLGVAASDETTALSTGNAKITFLTPRTGSLTKIVAGLSTSGSTTTSVRVNKNGVVVGTSTIDITANNFSSSITTPVLTATTFTAWDTYTVDITAAGTGAKGLKVYFEGNYSNPFTATTSTIPWQLGLAMSDETTSITTGTAKVTMLTPFSGTVTGVTISLSTSGSTLTTVNIKNNGTTMFSTKPTIDANEFSSQTAATPPVITGSTWNVYDTLTFDIDGAGTGAKGLKVWFTGTRNI